MPGLAPAQKAKKGRFGPGGTLPSVSASGPSSATAGVGVAFSGSASDATDGDLTASMTWTSDLDGALGTGGSPTLTFTTVGTHVVTVEATAPTGGQVATETLTVEVAA